MIGQCEVCGLKDPSIVWKRCEKHKRCDRCNQRPPDVHITFYTDGVFCRACREKNCKEIIDASEIHETDCMNNSNPVCPFCGYSEFQDTFEWGREGETECPRCESTFGYEVEYYPDWATYKPKKGE